MRAAPRNALGSVLGLLVLVAGAGASAAHTPEPAPLEAMAEMRVVDREATGPRQMRYVVRANSFPEIEPVEGGTVTAEATGPEGASVGPVALEPVGGEPGLYAGTVDFPTLGRWEVAITLASPAVTVSITESLVESTTTTTSITVDPVAAQADDDDGGGGSPLLPLVALAGAGAVAIAVLRPGARRRGRHSA